MGSGGAPPGIGQAGEDYLRSIYKLAEGEERVTTSGIAAAMKVSQPSATSMVKKLHGLGLIEHAPYRGVRLTERGRRAALELTRHHRLLELYLVERLGISREQAHAEADRLEHALSETVEKQMAESLGDPTSGPHGDSIPADPRASRP